MGAMGLFLKTTNCQPPNVTRERGKHSRHKRIDECHAEYGDRIVPFDDEVADLWGKMVAHLQKQGKMPPVIDSQIAATAVRYGMALVTRNMRDMADFGVEIVNPFVA